MPEEIEAAVADAETVRFAGYTCPFVFDEPSGKKIQHLLWGDFVGLLGPVDGEWSKVRARGETGWMKTEELQKNRLLELNFVDVGQGDGCFIVTPGDKPLLIDAGIGDNMERFLSWRYNLRRNPGRSITFDAAIITHPDADHYKGFSNLVRSRQFKFKAIYHNGIVERKGDNRLGPEDEVGGVTCLTELAHDEAELRRVLEESDFGEMPYPNLLKEALDDGPDVIKMLSSRDGHLPGYEDLDGLSIEVWGPVPEEGAGFALRTLGDDGKTKNGHSVCLRFVYRNVKIAMGGDLNGPAETYLLNHYSEGDVEELAGEERARALDRARERLEADVAKSCHHGSADFTTSFLRAVNATATIVSSGDDEPFAHPRPDALGALGKFGRGDRPLILSTELARSSKENIKRPFELRKEIEDLFDEREQVTDDLQRKALTEKIHVALAQIERSIAVYGLINVRTDGERVVLAQKLEKPAPGGKKWDLHRLEPDAAGDLRYVTKGE
ncbi:MAG TPA: MBL fold metallo-hydrolase [Actinomycetota bacterium]